MRKWCLALLLTTSSVLAQEHHTAYEALRVIGTQLNRDAVNHVISMTGVDGNPQPETWKVMLEDKTAQGGIREVEVNGGRIVSERTPLHAVVGSTEGATINTAQLNLDSSGAYSLASNTAQKSNARFTTVTYALRTDEGGEPIWVVTLQSQGRRPIGTIYIGANAGTVTRTEGMFDGAGMDQVVTGDDVDEEQEEENPDDENVLERKIKRLFYQARADTTRTFEKVRHSFVDFFNRN
jgi:hypothetical protein